MARRYAYLPSSLRGGVANYGDRDTLRLWRHRCLHLRHGLSMSSLNLMEGSHVWQCGSYAFVGDNHRPAGYCFSLFPPSRTKMSINTELVYSADNSITLIGWWMPASRVINRYPDNWTPLRQRRKCAIRPGLGPWRLWATGRITSRTTCAVYSLSLIQALGHGVTETQTNGENGVDCGQPNGVGWKQRMRKGEGETSSTGHHETETA